MALAFILACAPKISKKENRCSYIKEYFKIAVLPPPDTFKAYGKIKTGPVKLPFMVAKEGNRYTFKVARIKRTQLTSEKICFEDKCYLLPVPLERVIFDKLVSGKAKVVCPEGFIEYTAKGVYTIRVFPQDRMRRVEVINRKSKVKGEVKILLDQKGVAKRIGFKSGDQEAVLLFRGVSFEEKLLNDGVNGSYTGEGARN